MNFTQSVVLLAATIVAFVAMWEHHVFDAWLDSFTTAALYVASGARKLFRLL